MARLKLFAEVTTYPNTPAGEFAKVWITKSVADKLGIVPKEDWIYMSKDWMGVLSTQALVEGIIDEEGDRIYLSADRMSDAHFKENDKPKIWKLTEWE